MKITSKELIDCLQLLQDVGSQFEKKDDAIRSVEPETCQEMLLNVECRKAPLNGCGLSQWRSTFFVDGWMDGWNGMDFHENVFHSVRSHCFYHTRRCSAWNRFLLNSLTHVGLLFSLLNWWTGELNATPLLTHFIFMKQLRSSFFTKIPPEMNKKKKFIH